MNHSSLQTAKAIASWLITLWICYIFLGSLPYKFSAHPDTQHIFGTIGQWMEGIVGTAIGGWFANSGAYVVGGFELITSLVLLSPAVLWLGDKVGIRLISCARGCIHALGGLMAAAVMAGAVFFHVFTPLGIEVLHQGEPDGGSLFYAAVSIFILGLVLFAINGRPLLNFCGNFCAKFCGKFCPKSRPNSRPKSRK